MSAHATPRRATITGVVLAGGLGRRMGADGPGDDKGLRPFRGRPLAAHAIERLAPQVATLLVSANRNLERWRAFGVPVVTDRVDGFAGPLAGLHAAMSVAGTPWLATAPCDAPFVPTDLVARLARGAAASQARIAIARTAQRTQPVFMIVERELVGELGAFLGRGGRRVDEWAGALHAVEVAFDDADAFRNLNTPEDVARWEQARPTDDADPRMPR